MPTFRHERLRRLACDVGPIALVLALAAMARAYHWNRVFTDAGVRLSFDSDPLYHVMQAERIVSGRSPWFDPALNWPMGAAVPWPPLFAATIAAVARAVSASTPDRATIEAVAAILPVVLAVATVALVAALGRLLLGRGRGIGSAFLVSLLVGHVALSAVGRADQHVAEVLLHGGMVLGLALGVRSTTPRGRIAGAMLVGVAVAAGFWNWLGGALNLVVPFAFVGAVHVFVDDDAAAGRTARGLALGLGVGAALLALTVALLGPPGALGDGSLLGISGLSVAFTACGAAFAALLVAARGRDGARSRVRRLGEAVVAAMLPAAALVAFFPSVRDGIRSGLTALGAANPWYDSIFEFQPLLFSCHFPLRADLSNALTSFGLAPVAALLALPALSRRWRSAPAERPALLLVAIWALSLLALTLVRRRFAPYLTLPLALLACEGVASLAGYVSSRIGQWRRATNAGVALVLAGVIVVPSVRDLPVFFSQPPPTSIEALRWLATQPSPDGREGVLASWELGHLVLYHAGKPVVASPFGTEGGPGALQDTARFQFSDDASEAEGILLRRRLGFVVSGWPMLQAYMDGQLASPGNDLVRQTCDYGRGLVIDYAPAYLDRTGPRLFFRDGLPRPDRPAPSLGGLRLLYETTPGRKEQLKIFGVVAGARIRVVGAAPGEPVRGEVQLQTNQRRQLTWRTEAEAGMDGSAELRLPYATGMNGTVVAGEWRIVGGAREVVLPVAEDDVVLGRTVDVPLGAGPG